VSKAPLLTVATLVLGAAACLGPYPGIGEKLDVGSQVIGTSYISVDGGAPRILILDLDGGSSAPFTRIDEHQPRAVETLQGTWSGDLGGARFATDLAFSLPDEHTTPVISRNGATRMQLSPPVIDQATVTSTDGGSVDVTGSARFTGRYDPLLEATARIAGTETLVTTCAFYVANLAVESSEARIPGFNSAGLTQYLNRDTPFGGILSGTVTIRLDGLFSPVATFTYANYADFEGVVLDGQQVSSTDSAGNGGLSGVVRFRIARQGLPDLDGTLDYGQITLSNGNESGNYLVTLDGGTSVPVASGFRNPSLEVCLGF
jgi:hypothetical protein